MGFYKLFGLITVQQINQTLGKIHFWVTFVGTYCALLALYYFDTLKNIGVPRRYYSSETVAPKTFASDVFEYLVSFQNHVGMFIKVWLIIIAIAQVLFLVNLMYPVLRRLSTSEQ
jgi:cytochrome c oxidase subunit 1